MHLELENLHMGSGPQCVVVRGEVGRSTHSASIALSFPAASCAFLQGKPVGRAMTRNAVKHLMFTFRGFTLVKGLVRLGKRRRILENCRAIELAMVEMLHGIEDFRWQGADKWVV